MLFALRRFFLLRLCVDFFVVFPDEPAPVFEVAFEPVFATVCELADDEPAPAPVFEVAAFEPAVFEPAVFELAAPLAADDPEATLDVDEPDPAPLFEVADPDAAEPARDEPALEDAFEVDEPLEIDADGFVAAAARPSASIHAPAPASARSTSSTVTIKPTRRFGTGNGIDSSSFARRCWDVGCTLCAAAAGAAPFVCMREPGAGVGIGCAATCGLLGLRCTLGVSGKDAGGTFC